MEIKSQEKVFMFFGTAFGAVVVRCCQLLGII